MSRSLMTMAPVPGFMRTRAMACLRRPVAVTMSSFAISAFLSGVLGFEDGRLLRGVRVLVAGVDLELAHQRAAERRARQHAADGVLDEPGGVARGGLPGAELLQAAREHGVVDVLLVVPLLAGQLDLVGVDDDDEVAAVGVGREDRLVLAAQDAGDGGRGAAQHLVLDVDDQPVALDGLLAAHHRLHCCSTKPERAGYLRDRANPVNNRARARKRERARLFS